METKNDIAEKRKRQKSFIGKIIDRPVNFFVKHHINSNALSYMGLFIIILATVALSSGFTYEHPLLGMIAPILIIIGGLFDIFDGEVARRSNSDGPSGAFLDSVLDRIADAVLILGLMLGGFLDYIFGFVLLFLFIMISYSRARAENFGVEMRGVGIMERADRILFLAGALITETWLHPTARRFLKEPWELVVKYINTVPITPFLLWFFLIYALLLLITLLQRIAFTFKILKV